MVLVPVLGCDWGPTVSSAVSFLLTALIVGYIFAGKIWEEARMEAIARITVLAGALMIFYVISVPSLADWAPAIKEVWWVGGWFTVESMVLARVIFINVVMVLVLGFIGLYVGSMLRKPVKSQK